MLPSIGQLPPMIESSTGKPVRLMSGWLKSRAGEYSPAAGSHPSFWENVSCRISAIQKIGIDTPRIEPARMTWSAGRPGHAGRRSGQTGFRAASAMSSAAITSSTEAGAAVMMSDSTGR